MMTEIPKDLVASFSPFVVCFIQCAHEQVSMTILRCVLYAGGSGVLQDDCGMAKPVASFKGKMASKTQTSLFLLNEIDCSKSDAVENSDNIFQSVQKRLIS